MDHRPMKQVVWEPEGPAHEGYEHYPDEMTAEPGRGGAASRLVNMAGAAMSLALILGGALGTIIDRVFYGVLFGYGPLFMGKVVDFVHVDVWRGTLQDLIPFLGGGDIYFALFPIWNVADMAIVGGVVGILLFQQRFHDQRFAEAREAAAAREAADATSDADSARVVPAVTTPNGQASVASDTAPKATRPAAD